MKLGRFIYGPIRRPTSQFSLIKLSKILLFFFTRILGDYMRNVILLEIVVDKIIVMILIQKKCTMNYSCKNPLLNVITIILI